MLKQPGPIAGVTSLSLAIVTVHALQVELGPQQVPEEIADPIVRCRHAAAIARLHEGKVRGCRRGCRRHGREGAKQSASVCAERPLRADAGTYH